MNVSKSGNGTEIVMGVESIYIPFIISIIGMVGNFMTFVTIVKTDMRKVVNIFSCFLTDNFLKELREQLHPRAALLRHNCALPAVRPILVRNDDRQLCELRTGAIHPGGGRVRQ